MQCDGLRPCTPCYARGVECAFRAEQGETHGQATKRKYHELEHSYDTLHELVNNILSKGDRDATAILHRLKSGNDYDTVLAAIKDGDLLLRQASSPQQNARQDLLVVLAQSTADLREMIEVVGAAAVATNSLQKAELRQFKNRIADVETLLRLARGTPLTIQSPTSESEDEQSPLHEHQRSDIEVSAAPWTRLSTDDVFISNLISVFLRYVNPYWRYIEDEPFLRNMRSGRPGLFCSSFLVNAICAFACVSELKHLLCREPLINYRPASLRI